jgi:hypothetical protein
VTWGLRFPFGDVDGVFDQGTLRWAADGGTEPQHLLNIDDDAAFALVFLYRRWPITEPARPLPAARFHDV